MARRHHKLAAAVDAKAIEALLASDDDFGAPGVYASNFAPGPCCDSLAAQRTR